MCEVKSYVVSYIVGLDSEYKFDFHTNLLVTLTHFSFEYGKCNFNENWNPCVDNRATSNILNMCSLLVKKPITIKQNQRKWQHCMLLKIAISNDFHNLPVVPMKHKEIVTHLFQFSKRKLCCLFEIGILFCYFYKRIKRGVKQCAWHVCFKHFPITFNCTDRNRELNFMQFLDEFISSFEKEQK